MNIELIFDVGDIPECTVIEDVNDVGDSYEGMWRSFRGSYKVTVPKASCKPWVKQPDPLAATTKLIVEFGFVGTTDDGQHIKVVGSDDVRTRVLDRFALGRRTKAPLGAGNYVPGIDVFLVGEQASNPDKNTYHAPFCSVKACSGWLNTLLCKADIDERKLFWVNALDNDGSEVKLDDYYAYLKPKHVIALGKVAERQLAKYNVPYQGFPHPQYWKRFKSKEPYPLIAYLSSLSGPTS